MKLDIPTFQPTTNYSCQIVVVIMWCWSTARPAERRGSGRGLDQARMDCGPRSVKGGEILRAELFWFHFLWFLNITVCRILWFFSIKTSTSNCQCNDCRWPSATRSLGMSRLNNNRLLFWLTTLIITLNINYLNFRGRPDVSKITLSITKKRLVKGNKIWSIATLTFQGSAQILLLWILNIT